MKLATWLAAVPLCVFAAGDAYAQRFGAQLSYGFDSDFGVGARAEFDLAGKLSKTEPLSNAFVIAQFDWYFPDCGQGVDCTWWELNPSLAIPLKATNVKPYVGVGLNIAGVSVDVTGFGSTSDTEVGLNLLGGLKFGLGNLDAFSEARLSLGGGEQLALSFGVLFGRPKK